MKFEKENISTAHSEILVAMGKKHEEERAKLVTQEVELVSKVQRLEFETETMSTAHYELVVRIEKKHETEQAKPIKEREDLTNELSYVKA